MSKANIEVFAKVKSREYLYKTPKAVKLYGGGRLRRPAIEDEYREGEESRVVAINYRYGIMPTIDSKGVRSRRHWALPSESYECIAKVVGERDSNASIYKALWKSSEIDDSSVRKGWDSSQKRLHAPLHFCIDESLASYKHVLDEAKSEYAAFDLFCPTQAIFHERFTQQESVLVGFSRSIEELPESNWVNEPEGILQRLENKEAFPEDYEAAVLFAEVKPFPGEQRTRLLNALAKYINDNRFVEHQESLVTLCSAIRKYAMNMPEARFEEYAKWLLPTETATLHHEAEMEFAKGICWRLEFEPHHWPAEYPLLSRTLFDLVDSYLTPRLILQKSYANTAMFGLVALHVLEGGSTSKKPLVAHLRTKMLDSGVNWFIEMVDDHVDAAIQYISERDEALAKAVSKIRQG